MRRTRLILDKLRRWKAVNSSRVRVTALWFWWFKSCGEAITFVIENLWCMIFLSRWMIMTFEFFGRRSVSAALLSRNLWTNMVWRFMFLKRHKEQRLRIGMMRVIMLPKSVEMKRMILVLTNRQEFAISVGVEGCKLIFSKSRDPKGILLDPNERLHNIKVLKNSHN